MRRSLLVLTAVLALPHPSGAQQAAAIRGGWVADVAGRTAVYMLIVRGNAVTGTYCVDCADPRNLAFIRDGRIEGGGVSFVIRHENRLGKVTLDDVRGTLRDPDLVLSVKRRGGPRPSTVMLHRPAPAPKVRAVSNDQAETLGAPMRPPYVLPGPAEQLNADKVLGLWLWGTGPGKQYFIIRRLGTQLLGMVCGPCENPSTMAPLDGFVLNGTALTFNIVHEDTGDAAEHGPFNNVAHATLARHEMHLKVIPSYAPSDSKPIEMTLLGPVVEPQAPGPVANR
jgi:hypothetical protein